MHIELAILLAYHMHDSAGEGCEVKGHWQGRWPYSAKETSLYSDALPRRMLGLPLLGLVLELQLNHLSQHYQKCPIADSCL